jgi:hypothetical protein
MAQHLEALERANEVRFARLDLKRAIKAREVLASEVLLSHIPDWLEGMRVEELILAAPRMQRRVFHRAMNANHIRLTARVGDLTPRKRHALADRIAEWESRRLDRIGAAAMTFTPSQLTNERSSNA